MTTKIKQINYLNQGQELYLFTYFYCYYYYYYYYYYVFISCVLLFLSIFLPVSLPPSSAFSYCITNSLSLSPLYYLCLLYSPSPNFSPLSFYLILSLSPLLFHSSLFLSPLYLSLPFFPLPLSFLFPFLSLSHPSFSQSLLLFSKKILCPMFLSIIKLLDFKSLL